MIDAAMPTLPKKMIVAAIGVINPITDNAPQRTAKSAIAKVENGALP